MSIDVMEDINKLIEKLEKSSIAKHISEKFQINNDIEINNREINVLIGYASILSLNENSDDKILSYEIISRLIEYTSGNNENVISAADLVFSRIGNFPGRSLLRDRHSTDEKSLIPQHLMLESIARETENTFFTDEGRETLLTDFQYKFISSLDSEDSISVSAPTSAGKSFVLNLDLARKVKEQPKQCIVYIVPTRALISEVSSRIRQTIKNEKLKDVIIRTAPFPIEKEKIKQAAIYVLTQERLMSFLNSQENKPYITSLIVDEAHEIKNGKRGVILQSAIDISLRRFSSAKVLFASPLIKNPSYFLTLFGRTSNGLYFTETVSPVSQNIIMVSEVPHKPKQLDISLLSRNNTVHVGKATTNFKFRNKKVIQRANLAVAISSNEDAVISYSNNPSEAEKIACEIANTPNNFTPSQEVLILVEFIKKEVHSDFPLADCLLNGAAYHYGNMPSLVRSGVENLFKNGDIKIICCTSTLLQGVNLPAKHIIIENPMSGDNPMTRADFLNLSGRAGRLLHEFHGNIWCIRPSEWKSDCYNGDKLQDISSAIGDIMKDGGVAIQTLLNDFEQSKNEKNDAEAAFGKLYYDYLTEPDLGFAERYRTEHNSDILDRTFDTIKHIKVNLPTDLIESNQSLRPDHLQRLYDRLFQETDLSSWTLLSPYTSGAKDRMDKVISIICDCFEWDISEKYRSWISFLSYKWIWGTPIGQILSERVSHQRSKGSKDSSSSIIRGCLGVLEEAIRFKLVKYFSAYIDVLKLVALEKDSKEKFENIEPYHIYLEFGSCNRNALNLMALGISRFTALHLENKFDLSDDVESEAYLESMSKMNIDAIPMPAICRKEIKDLIF